MKRRYCAINSNLIAQLLSEPGRDNGQYDTKSAESESGGGSRAAGQHEQPDKATQQSQAAYYE